MNHRFPSVFRRMLRLGLPALLLCGSAFAGEETRTLTQMSGEPVTLPAHIKRVYTFSHSFALMAALAPETLAGFPSPFMLTPAHLAYLPPAVRDLPPLPGGQGMDLEAIKAARLDLAVGWDTPGFRREQGAQLKRVGLPALLVRVDRLEEYPASFRYLGRIFGRVERGEALAGYIETARQRLQQALADLPPEQRVRVYYAESLDGLTSQCGRADRAEVIWLAGGINALPCGEVAGHQAKPADLETSNATPGFETLLKLDPPVIVTRFSATAKRLMTDPRWQHLSAVREHRVYAIPSLPFNWFDRPPSYMRIMGAQWLANILYPQRYALDMAAETSRFYRLFFNVELSPQQVQQLLTPPLQ